MTDNREQLSNLLTTALRTLDDNQISHLAYSLLERIPADKWPAGLVKKEEWIDVRDELPNRMEKVLCLWHPDAVDAGNNLISYQFLIDEAGYRYGSITHWMRTPAPPSQLKK